MTAFTHMHHEMANKALMQASYTEGLADRPAKCAARIRELIMSGAADPKSRWFPVAVTDNDRRIALRYIVPSA